ncbi:MAG: cation-transporting P-type ATPase [Actinomycetota bacterium]
MAGVTTAPGLSAREAADRLARDGPNELPAERPRGLLRLALVGADVAERGLGRMVRGVPVVEAPGNLNRLARVPFARVKRP